jgi:hypothetical protein
MKGLEVNKCKHFRTRYCVGDSWMDQYFNGSPCSKKLCRPSGVNKTKGWVHGLKNKSLGRGLVIPYMTTICDPGLIPFSILVVYLSFPVTIKGPNSLPMKRTIQRLCFNQPLRSTVRAYQHGDMLSYFPPCTLIRDDTSPNQLTVHI